MLIENTIRTDTRKPRNRLTAAVKPVLTISLTILLFLAFTVASASVSPYANAEPGAETGSNSSEKLTLEIVEIDSAIKDLNSRMSSLKSESASLENEIADTQEKLESKQEEVADGKGRLNSRVREMYMNGRSSTLEAFLTSEDFDEFMVQRDYAEMVASNDAELLNEVKRRSEELDRTLAGLKQKKTEAQNLLNDLEAEKSDLQKRKNEREKVLAQAGSNRDEVVSKSSHAESRIEEINPADSEPPPPGKEIIMVATAYSPEEPGLSDSTATGLKAQKGVVAVDPSFIPLGTRVYVEGYGYAIAADTGGAIKGNRIDLCYNTLAEALAFGRRKVKVKVLD
ncbi:MAG: hypothetical protein JW738_06950 [Actinobacteria bacterium]|nr:hypothetical protein [Actinomycetota bacterium]